MKIRILIMACLLSGISHIACFSQQTKELQSRKIRIVTATEETYLTSKVLLKDSVLVFTGDEATDSLAYKDIIYIYIKEGSNFPQVMLYCISFGLCYGVVMGLLSTTTSFMGNIAIGLGAGVIAGLIVAPFTSKPEKLIFYKGKWTESKYAP